MKAIFLDFDGVIVDSLKEWYYIGVLSYYGIDKKIPGSQHRKAYRDNSHYLYSSKDEYCLLKALDIESVDSFQKIQKNVSQEEVETYCSNFRKIRKFYQNNHLDWWCSLYHLTDYGSSLTTEDLPQNLFILTRKSMNDVLILKNYFNLTIPDLNMFGYDHSVRYGGKVSFIEDFLSKRSDYSQAILVDDRIENFRPSPTVQCCFAPWGYGKRNEEEPESNSYIGVAPLELFRIDCVP